MGLIESDGLVGTQKVKDADARDVSKFLNRILGLRVEQQNMVWTSYCIIGYSVSFTFYVAFDNNCHTILGLNIAQ